MPTHNNIRCTIQIANGRHSYSGPLEEYPASNEDYLDPPNAKTVYVIAQELAEFSLNFELLQEYNFEIGDFVRMRVWIDGEEVSGKVLDQEYPRAMLKGAASWTAHGNWIYPFQFVKLWLVEDYESEIRPRETMKWGEILVCAIRCSGETTVASVPFSPNEDPSKEKLNEKVLKGRNLSHVTRFGRATGIYNTGTVRFKEQFDTPENPYVCFRILYRSKQTLQSLGLIPAGHTESPRIKDEPCSDEEIDTFLVGEMNAATVEKTPEESENESEMSGRTIEQENGIEKEEGEILPPRNQETQGIIEKKAELIDLT